jgi:hypothetical protein
LGLIDLAVVTGKIDDVRLIDALRLQVKAICHNLGNQQEQRGCLLYLGISAIWLRRATKHLGLAFEHGIQSAGRNNKVGFDRIAESDCALSELALNLYR